MCSPYQARLLADPEPRKVDEASRHGASAQWRALRSTRPQHVLRRGNRAGPEPILELSGDALTESPSLKRREISQSHVVGFDHGVRLQRLRGERADDEPGVTARLGKRAPSAEQLSPVEILRGPSSLRETHPTRRAAGLVGRRQAVLTAQSGRLRAGLTAPGLRHLSGCRP